MASRTWSFPRKEKETLLTPDYLQLIQDRTGFDGSTEDLSTLILEAYGTVSADTGFMATLKTPTSGPVTQTRAGQDIRSLKDYFKNLNDSPWSLSPTSNFLKIGGMSAEGAYDYFTKPI